MFVNLNLTTFGLSVLWEEIIMNTKICKKCKEVKDISHYSKRNKGSKDGLQFDCKECQNKRNKESYYRNKENVLKRQREYNKNNKKRINQRVNLYQQQKRQKDISFRIAFNYRIRICNAIKGIAAKSDTTINLLGCSVEEFKIYLESKFSKGMNWDNYGYYGWHIDHIKPCSSFDLSDPVEQQKCFHYSNLQPLWAKDNLIKSNKII